MPRAPRPDHPSRTSCPPSEREIEVPDASKHHWCLLPDGDLIFELSQELLANARHLLEVIDAFERAILLTIDHNGLRLR